MKLSQTKVFLVIVLCLVSTLTMSGASAEETIIQKEKVSFEKCLKIITSSEDKLSVAPDITDVSEQKRTAIFKLFDGSLKITCDGEEGSVTVSTNAN